MPSNLNRKQRQLAPYDYKKKWTFFRYKKVYKSYDTKYLRALVDDKPFINKGNYNSLTLNKDDIVTNFPAINENYDLND